MIRSDGSPMPHEMGLSIYLEGAIQPSEVVGRPDRVRWVAPEILEGEAHSSMSDMYMFGCLVLSIMTLQEPFSSVRKNAAVVRARLSKKLPSFGEYPELRREPEMLWLLLDCWSHEPSRRPSMAEFAARFEKIDRQRIKQPEEQNTTQQE